MAVRGSRPLLPSTTRLVSGALLGALWAGLVGWTWHTTSSPRRGGVLLYLHCFIAVLAVRSFGPALLRALRDRPEWRGQIGEVSSYVSGFAFTLFMLGLQYGHVLPSFGDDARAFLAVVVMAVYVLGLILAVFFGLSAQEHRAGQHALRNSILWMAAPVVSTFVNCVFSP
jgi:hypothetical protein